MSTFSNREADKNLQLSASTLQSFQGIILSYYSFIKDCRDKITLLRNKKPCTLKEFAEQQNEIQILENQINGTQKLINATSAKAAVLARSFGFTL